MEEDSAEEAVLYKPVASWALYPAYPWSRQHQRGNPSQLVPASLLVRQSV